MSEPTLPAYLGSWKELIQKLLHDPFLGSGGGPHPPRTHLETFGPSPDPWSPTASLIAMVAAMKDIASRLPESQKQVASVLSAVAADWEDGICPPPRPRPHVLVAAVEVMALASSMEQGSVRTSLAREAGTILEKSFAGGERSSALTAVA
jgi:hypothetical protein